MHVTETAGAHDLYFYWHGLLMPSNPVRSKHLRPSRLVQYGYRRPSCHVRYRHGMLRPSCHLCYKHSRPSRHYVTEMVGRHTMFVKSAVDHLDTYVGETVGRHAMFVKSAVDHLDTYVGETVGRHAIFVKSAVDHLDTYVEETVGRHAMFAKSAACTLQAWKARAATPCAS